MKEAIEFLKWCDTPMYRSENELSFRLRCIPQFPDYDVYMVIDKNGNNVFAHTEKLFLTVEELYDHWLKQQQNESK